MGFRSSQAIFQRKQEVAGVLDRNTGVRQQEEIKVMPIFETAITGKSKLIDKMGC